MLFWTLSGLTLLLTVLTFLPLWRYEAWWVRGGDFPRLQFAIAALALLAIAALVLDLSRPGSWAVIAASLVCLLYQSWWILPYTPLYPKEVKAAALADRDNTLRIMAANVMTPNRNASALLAIVEANRPSVLVAVETDEWWQAQLDVLERDYPHALKCPQDNLYGMHLYSRLPLEDGEIQFLVEDGTPSIHTVVILRSGCRVRLHVLHPAPPSPTENDESSERDAELIIVGKSVAKSELPVVVTGDLNDVAWSATTRLFRKISGLLDPRVGRMMCNTFHARYPFFRWPLDHLFHSHHFTLSRLERLPAFGSDHFPILIELAFEPSRGKQQEGLDADADDHAWAEEKAAAENADEGDVHTPGR